MHTIVIIDDNLALVEMISSAIEWEEIGCRVAGVANDGVKGRALIVAKQPDIIISDIRMPGLDGLKMIETAKAFSPHSRVIFISAYEDFRYARKALALRASDYLLKPFSKKEIVESVRAAIREIPSPHAMPSAAEEMPKHPEDHTTLMVSSMLEYVRTHISYPLRLSDLSRHFGVSPSYISTIVKRQTGQNFSEWVTRARIEYAKKLLRRPVHRIEEIAFLVGYKNYVTLYKVFVKYEGMSPTHYRNLKGGGAREDTD